MFRSMLLALVLLFALASPAAAAPPTERWATEFLTVWSVTGDCSNTCTEYFLSAGTSTRAGATNSISIEIDTWTPNSFTAEYGSVESSADLIAKSGKITFSIAPTQITLDSGRVITLSARTHYDRLPVTDEGTISSECSRHHFVKRDSDEATGSPTGFTRVDGSKLPTTYVRMGTVKHQITTTC